MTAGELFKLKNKELWTKIYAMIHWQNKPSTATPLGKSNLNKMDIAINTLDNRVIQLQAEKLDVDVANLMVSSWVMDMNTYVITVTLLNGTTKTYDLNLERIPVDISLDKETGIMTFVYADDSSDSINISDLIKDTVYDDSETIGFQKTFHDDVYHVTAIIKNNSIEERHLNTEVMQDIRNNANVAQSAANDSLSFSKDSKRWAVGDDEYAGSEVDNSKYYCEQAEKAKDAAEQARDEAQGATGVVIMSPGVLGIGMPDGKTIKIKEDGTFYTEIENAKDLLITDSQGLEANAGEETNVQALIDAIAERVANKLVTSDSLTSQLANYMTKSMMSNQQVNDQNKVPTSALVYLMSQEITQLNSDLATKSGIISGTYVDLKWEKSGKIGVLSASNQVKVVMYADNSYPLCRLPFDVSSFYNIITTGNNRWAFLTIVNNEVSITPYTNHMEAGNWIYFSVSLILV